MCIRDRLGATCALRATVVAHRTVTAVAAVAMRSTRMASPTVLRTTKRPTFAFRADQITTLAMRLTGLSRT
eukprot:11107795-Lingulodinium_polyedra.AAC.1